MYKTAYLRKISYGHLRLKIVKMHYLFCEKILKFLQKVPQAAQEVLQLAAAPLSFLQLTLEVYVNINVV